MVIGAELFKYFVFMHVFTLYIHYICLSTRHHPHAEGENSSGEPLCEVPDPYQRSKRLWVTQRTCCWREKSIFSFRSATGLSAATARWARGLSKIHTCLAVSKASGLCVFQRKCWGKRFCGSPCALDSVCSLTMSLLVPTLNQSPTTPISVIFSSRHGSLSIAPHLVVWGHLCLYRDTSGVKGRRHQTEEEKSISSRTVVSSGCASVTWKEREGGRVGGTIPGTQPTANAP